MSASLLRFPFVGAVRAMPLSAARLLRDAPRHLSVLAPSGRHQALAATGTMHSTGVSSMLALLGGVRAFRVPAAFRADNSSRAPNARRPGRRAAKLLGKIKAKRLRLRRNKPN